MCRTADDLILEMTGYELQTNAQWTNRLGGGGAEPIIPIALGM